MNSFINLILLVISLPALFVAVFVGFDLPIEFLHTTAGQLPYRFALLASFAMLLLIVSLRRSIRRWMGVKMCEQTAKFVWNQPISNRRTKRVLVYNSLEAGIFLALAVGVISICKEAWPLGLVYLLMCIDALSFAFMNRLKFRVALSSKAILVADREVILIYLSGLRKVSISQQTIYFDYIENLQLSFPVDCLAEEQKADFFTVLESQIDRDRVLFQHTK